MKSFRNSGNFLLALLINMSLNLKWTIPAWILLACHYFFYWKIRWFWIALGVWLVNILLWMDIMGWATRYGSEKDPPKENKNPYSVGAKETQNKDQDMNRQQNRD